MKANNQTNFLLSKLGPGLLFAGAAIGTSHLVQSTRAGAVYGLGLLTIIILANLLKYPTYRFGPTYAAATGMSLVEGYRRLGKWAVITLSVTQIAVHAIIVAATAVTTAGIAVATLNLSIKATHFGVGLTSLALLLLFTGGFRWLDRMTKVFVAILTVSTVTATILALPNVDWSISNFALPEIDVPTFVFIVALMGFMPSAMDLSILQSLWCVAKSRTQDRVISREETLFDFNFGYLASAGLAICFLIMGAGVLNPQNTVPAGGAVEFSQQVISLYTNNLGNWAGTLVGLSAFGVMFTTLITVLDGFPRVHAAAYYTLVNSNGQVHQSLDGTRPFIAVSIALAFGASFILLFMMSNFLGFIDFITITAFLVGPIIAVLNHMVITSKLVPADHQPSKLMRVWSLIGIIALSGIAIAYLYTRLGS